MATQKPSVSVTKKATNLSLRASLLSEARALQINIPHAAADGISGAIAEKRAALWQKENTKAAESSNAYVEKHGLPLDKNRMF